MWDILLLQLSSNFIEITPITCDIFTYYRYPIVLRIFWVFKFSKHRKSYHKSICIKICVRPIKLNFLVSCLPSFNCINIPFSTSWIIVRRDSCVIGVCKQTSGFIDIFRKLFRNRNSNFNVVLQEKACLSPYKMIFYCWYMGIKVNYRR